MKYVLVVLVALLVTTQLTDAARRDFQKMSTQFLGVLKKGLKPRVNSAKSRRPAGRTKNCPSTSRIEAKVTSLVSRPRDTETAPFSSVKSSRDRGIASPGQAPLGRKPSPMRSRRTSRSSPVQMSTLSVKHSPAESALGAGASSLSANHNLTPRDSSTRPLRGAVILSLSPTL